MLEKLKKIAKPGTEVSNIRFPYSLCSTMERMEKTLSGSIEDQNQRYNVYYYYYYYYLIVG
jgi:hypothetical protein